MRLEWEPGDRPYLVTLEVLVHAPDVETAALRAMRFWDDTFLDCWNDDHLRGVYAQWGSVSEIKLDDARP